MNKYLRKFFVVVAWIGAFVGVSILVLWVDYLIR